MRKFVASCNLQLERGLIHCNIYETCTGYDVTLSGISSGVSHCIMRYYKDSNSWVSSLETFLIKSCVMTVIQAINDATCYKPLIEYTIFGGIWVACYSKGSELYAEFFNSDSKPMCRYSLSNQKLFLLSDDQFFAEFVANEVEEHYEMFLRKAKESTKLSCDSKDISIEYIR